MVSFYTFKYIYNWQPNQLRIEINVHSPILSNKVGNPFLFGFLKIFFLKKIKRNPFLTLYFNNLLFYLHMQF